MEVYILFETTRPGICPIIISNQAPEYHYRGCFDSLEGAKEHANLIRSYLPREDGEIDWLDVAKGYEFYGSCTKGGTLHFVILKDKVRAG